MQIKRTFVAAVAVAAVAAPSASASVAVDPVAAPVAESTQVSRYAEIAAHHEAARARNMRQAESAPTVQIVRPDSGGFDWTSALVGGSVPLALLLIDLLAGPAVTRRRTRAAALA